MVRNDRGVDEGAAAAADDDDVDEEQRTSSQANVTTVIDGDEKASGGCSDERRCGDADTDDDSAPVPNVPSTAGRIDMALRRKTDGNEHFAAGRLDAACIAYRAGLEALSPPSPVSAPPRPEEGNPAAADDAAVMARTGRSLDLARGSTFGSDISYSPSPSPDRAMAETAKVSVDAEAKATEAALRSNLALVLHRMGDDAESERECTVALQCDPECAKLWYRRAQARECLVPHPDLAGAESDLVRCLSLLEQQHEQQSQPQAPSCSAAAAGGGQCGNAERKRAAKSTTTASAAANRKGLRDAREALSRIRSKRRKQASSSPSSRRRKERNQKIVTPSAKLEHKEVEQGGAFVESRRSPPHHPAVVTRFVPPEDSSTSDADGIYTDEDGAAEVVAAAAVPATPQDARLNGGGAAVTPTPTRSIERPHRPSPDEQRDDVIRLLVQYWQRGRPSCNDGDGENTASSSPSSSSSSHPARYGSKGEAFCLVPANWWYAWCRHVNFFRDKELRNPNLSKLSAEKRTQLVRAVEKRRDDALAALLPPGASPPPPVEPKKKKEKEGKDSRRSSSRATSSTSSSSSSDESSSSSDESDEEVNWAGGYGPVPGVIDNGLLLLRSLTSGKRRRGEKTKASFGSSHDRDVFFHEWRHIGGGESDDGGDGENHTNSTSEEDVHQRRETKGSVSHHPLRLRPNLVRGHHYELLPREACVPLRCWYGQRGPSIVRRAASVSPSADCGALRVDLYPELRQREADSGENGSTSPRRQSTAVTTARATTQQARACGACRVTTARSRCTRCLAVYYCGRGCQQSHWQYHRTACRAARISGGVQLGLAADRAWGRVGLNNLGNTCFMNSALQCMSHVAPLTRHFLTNRFRDDLNETNPIGTGGKLASAYDTVIKDLWMSGHKNASISPVSLKRAIAAFAPQFAGVSQHDAHDFLAFLLDGLHEDLNRIRNAPYAEMPDANNGRKLAICGAEAWDAHSRRNDSLVMDTFYGQFKSTCVCPKCEKVSISFEPFNHVTLEIPQNMTRVIPVLVFRAVSTANTSTNTPKPSSLPLRYGVTVPKNGSVSELKHALSGLCGIPPLRLALCDVYENNVYEILQDGKSMATIRADDVIAAYEVDPYTNATIHAIATHISCDDRRHVPECSDRSGQAGGKELFGFPLLTSFDCRFTCSQVFDHFWHQVRHLLPVKDEEGQICGDALKSLLRIRVVDNNGRPRPLFKSGKSLGTAQPTVDSNEASLLPRESNEKIMSFLGKDCTGRFLFVSLEWTDEKDGNGNSRLQSSEENVEMGCVEKCRFSVFSDHPSLASAVQKQRALQNSVTLDQCFESFTRPERLDENNKWYCSHCKEHVRAMKTMHLWRLPNVLVVHLKRFEYKHALRREKLETFVDFQMEGLDMSRHCARLKKTDLGGTFVVDDDIPAVYDLFGVTNHYGRMGFGHYTAHARKWNESDMENEWALFDDSNVQNVGDGTGRSSGGMVVSSAAYILFYRRRIFS